MVQQRVLVLAASACISSGPSPMGPGAPAAESIRLHQYVGRMWPDGPNFTEIFWHFNKREAGGQGQEFRCDIAARCAVASVMLAAVGCCIVQRSHGVLCRGRAVAVPLQRP